MNVSLLTEPVSIFATGLGWKLRVGAGLGESVGLTVGAARVGSGGLVGEGAAVA